LSLKTRKPPPAHDIISRTRYDMRVFDRRNFCFIRCRGTTAAWHQDASAGTLPSYHGGRSRAGRAALIVL